MKKSIMEEEIICESKSKKQPDFILTVKKICIYNEKQREYDFIRLEDISNWRYDVVEWKFIFNEVSGKTFTTKTIKNHVEMYDALCNLIPEKCLNTLEDIETTLLSVGEEIVCKSAEGDIILTAKNIWIVDKTRCDYISLEFEDILNWQYYYTGSSTMGYFTFQTKSKKFNVDNGYYHKNKMMYSALYKIIPEKCIISPYTHSRLYTEYDWDKDNLNEEGNFKNYIKEDLSIKKNLTSANKNKSGLYNIIINKIGPNKYDVMRLIKSYTLEDIFKISEKLNNLPCVIMEDSSELQTERIISQLTDLGAEVYKK